MTRVKLGLSTLVVSLVTPDEGSPYLLLTPLAGGDRSALRRLVVEAQRLGELLEGRPQA